MVNLDTLMTYANASQKALITGFQQAQKEFYTNLPNNNTINNATNNDNNASKLEFIREPIGGEQGGGGKLNTKKYNTFLSVNNDVPVYSKYGTDNNQFNNYWKYNIIGGHKKTNKQKHNKQKHNKQKKSKQKYNKQKYNNKKGGDSIYLSVDNNVPAYSRYGADSNQCGSYWNYSKQKGGKSLKRQTMKKIYEN